MCPAAGLFPADDLHPGQTLSSPLMSIRFSYNSFFHEEGTGTHPLHQRMGLKSSEEEILFASRCVRVQNHRSLLNGITVIRREDTFGKQRTDLTGGTLEQHETVR